MFTISISILDTIEPIILFYEKPDLDVWICSSVLFVVIHLYGISNYLIVLSLKMSVELEWYSASPFADFQRNCFWISWSLRLPHFGQSFLPLLNLVLPKVCSFHVRSRVEIFTEFRDEFDRNHVLEKYWNDIFIIQFLSKGNHVVLEPSLPASPPNRVIWIDNREVDMYTFFFLS